MESIGVFFGSRSPEHDVSIITGQLIIAGLKELGKYNVIPVYIGKRGVWYSGDELSDLKFYQSPDKESRLAGFSGFALDLVASRGKMVLVKNGLLGKKRLIIDVAFPAFHGQNGEDGTIQGLFELCGIPYVGCDVTASAVTMDKILTKLLYERFKIPTTKFIYFEKREWENDRNGLCERIRSELALPYFVKPARLGSSIGIAKVKETKDLEFAIEVALHYDSKVLVEVGLENVMDITCAVIGNKELRPSLLQESVFAGSDFYSYDEKYIKGGGSQIGKATAGFRIPAPLDVQKTEEIQKLALRVFGLFGCSGIARIDFLYDQASQVAYANEINTLPGTLYHHLWKASGLPFSELLTALLAYAKERHEDGALLMRVFQSDILKNVGEGKLANKLSREA